MLDAHGPPASRRSEGRPSVAAVRRAARSFLADHAPLFMTGAVRWEKFSPRQLRGVAVNRLRRALRLRGGDEQRIRAAGAREKSGSKNNEKVATEYATWYPTKNMDTSLFRGATLKH